MNLEKQTADANNPPDLLTVVQTGLVRLMARKLRFGPQPADLPVVAEVMTEDLVRAGKTKHLRIREALEYIGRTDRDWPQPARVIEVISEASRQTSTYKELAAPGPDKSLGDTNLKVMREILEKAKSCVDNGQKPKHFDNKKHIESVNGDMPLTDEQLIELQRIYSQADKGDRIRLQSEYMASIKAQVFRQVGDEVKNLTKESVV